MQEAKQHLKVTKEDHQAIMSYLRSGSGKNRYTRQEAENLMAELKKAKLISSKTATDIVRLNSTVTVRDEKEGKVMDVIVVLPEKADIKQRQISIFSPIGTALIGFKKGSVICWNVPTGEKTFRILDVQPC